MLPAIEIGGINALPCGIGPIYQAFFFAGSIYAPDYKTALASSERNYNADV